MHPLSEALGKGLASLGLDLDEATQAKLLAYLDLIAKWTKVYNLTAVRDAEEMLSHHVLDSLAVISPLRREMTALPRADAQRSLLDVGSGAGLPGVVIAIVCPEVQVTCVDTVAKKAAFIQQVAVSLKLPNLKGLHARVETLTQAFDIVCSRAFASLLDFTTWSRAALASDGVWLAMKGKLPEQEMQVLPKDVKVFHVEPLHVPGLDANRCIVWMRG
ncbi:MAG: rRNA ((527)-N(7))-methyltransferase RsmG [Pseudomonadota bacterium]|jgi:16S rRNA (guanine527-N7)-methyltransferase